MFALRLFGSPSLIGEDDSAPVGGPASQRHRLALLALLALASGRGVGREKLMGYLWPERDAEHARLLLNQAVYTLRKVLGESAILSDLGELRLNPDVITADAAEFSAAVAAGAWERAVALHSGPLLDGFFLSDAPDFERWVERERARLAGACGKALEALALAAERERDFARAAEWWTARATHDPYDSVVAFRLISALEASGNRGGALQHAARHERLLRTELGTRPPPELLALEARLRGDPATGTGQRSPVPAALDRAATSSYTLGEAERLAPAAPGVVPATPVANPVAAPRRRRHAVRYAIAALWLCIALLGATWLQLHRGAVRPPGAPPRRNPTRNIAAYELYVRGTDRALFRSDSGMRAGIALMQQAIALDSTYAAAWAELGLMYGRIAATGRIRDRARYFTLAEQATATAVRLDDSLTESHAALGAVRMEAFDFPSAERELNRAIALDSGRALPHEWLVSLLISTGRPREALVHAERALSLDPLAPDAHAEVARALLGNDRCDEALAELQRLAELQPPLLRVTPITAECYARKAMWPEAIAMLRLRAQHGEPTPLALLGYMLARDGQQAEARRIRATLYERWQRGDVGAFWIALVSTGLGEREVACDWLDRSVADRSLSGGPFNPSQDMIAGPLFADLRGQPRFERLRQRLGLRPAHPAA